MRVIDWVFNAIGFLDGIRASRHDDPWNAERKKLLRSCTYGVMPWVVFAMLALAAQESGSVRAAGPSDPMNAALTEVYTFSGNVAAMVAAAAFVWWMAACWRLYRFLQDPTK